MTAVSQTILRQLPAGTQPPLIINYSASTVPILQLALSGLSESELNDVGQNLALRRVFRRVPQSSMGCYCAAILLRSSVRLTSLGRRPGRRHERRGVGSLRDGRRGRNDPGTPDGWPITVTFQTSP